MPLATTGASTKCPPQNSIVKQQQQEECRGGAVKSCGNANCARRNGQIGIPTGQNPNDPQQRQAEVQNTTKTRTCSLGTKALNKKSAEMSVNNNNRCSERTTPKRKTSTGSGCRQCKPAPEPQTTKNNIPLEGRKKNTTPSRGGLGRQVGTPSEARQQPTTPSTIGSKGSVSPVAAVNRMGPSRENQAVQAMPAMNKMLPTTALVDQINSASATKSSKRVSISNDVGGHENDLTKVYYC